MPSTENLEVEELNSRGPRLDGGSPAWIRTTINLTIVKSVSYGIIDLTLLTGLINRRAFVHSLYARECTFRAG